MRLKIYAKIVHLFDLFLDNELNAEATNKPVLLQPFLKMLIVLKYLVVHDDLLVLSMLLHQLDMLLLNNFIDVLQRAAFLLLVSSL